MGGEVEHLFLALAAQIEVAIHHQQLVAEAATLDDELLVADCDLDLCRQGKEKMFNFAAHRRPEHYAPIVGQVGVVEPIAGGVAS